MFVVPPSDPTHTHNRDEPLAGALATTLRCLQCGELHCILSKAGRPPQHPRYPSQVQSEGRHTSPLQWEQELAISLGAHPPPPPCTTDNRGEGGRWVDRQAGREGGVEGWGGEGEAIPPFLPSPSSSHTLLPEHVKEVDPFQASTPSYSQSPIQTEKRRGRSILTSLESLAMTTSSSSMDLQVWTLPTVFLSRFCLQAHETVRGKRVETSQSSIPPSFPCPPHLPSTSSTYYLRGDC